MRDGHLHRVHHVGIRSRLGSNPAAWLLCVLACTPLVTAGCNVQVDKSEDGKKVKVATPFGSVAVNKDQPSAGEVGLPTYPGATLDTDKDGNQSARVDLGFGSWKLRVRIAHYTSADDQDQVLAFYRKALSTYGVVIECAGKRTIGTPARTGEGLTCNDDESGQHSGSHTFTSDKGDEIELKAGSQHHQHLVVLKTKETAPTHFSLVALDLPHGDDEQKGTN